MLDLLLGIVSLELAFKRFSGIRDTHVMRRKPKKSLGSWSSEGVGNVANVTPITGLLLGNLAL